MGLSCKNFSINLLVVLLLPIISKPCLGSPRSGATSAEFIKTSCAATSYPTLCYTSLSTHASAIQKSPKLLAHTALSVALSTAKTTSSSMVQLSKTPGLKAREIGAMQDCVEEMGESVEQMQRSLSEMSSLREAEFRMMISDVQTWVSAALTDEDTCTEGFSEMMMKGDVEKAVRENIFKIVHLTSNALALINAYASVHG
uniref:Pectinesterase inhibitor domain-containing protein n=1 Tax=Kalanchoe fedtschenkoi TaxID=63787 RepID=A0A7N1A6A8_KALFE